MQQPLHARRECPQKFRQHSTRVSRDDAERVREVGKRGHSEAVKLVLEILFKNANTAAQARNFTATRKWKTRIVRSLDGREQMAAQRAAPLRANDLAQESLVEGV